MRFIDDRDVVFGIRETLVLCVHSVEVFLVFYPHLPSSCSCLFHASGVFFFIWGLFERDLWGLEEEMLFDSEDVLVVLAIR